MPSSIGASIFDPVTNSIVVIVVMLIYFETWERCAKDVDSDFVSLIIPSDLLSNRFTS